MLTDFHQPSGDSGNDGALAVAIQADGKILAGGSNTNPDDYSLGGVALARYLPDGSLDHSFGSNGQATLWPRCCGQEAAAALALLQDGRILVGISSSLAAFKLARYLPSGTLDASFGRGGVAQPVFVVLRGAGSFLHSLAVEPNGQILEAGSTLVRFNSDGSIDRYFGRYGVVWNPIDPGAAITGIALDGHHRVVAAGVTVDYNYNPTGTVLARYWAGSVHCRVPRVRGRTLQHAIGMLQAAHCHVGHPVFRRSRRVAKGHVIAPRPKAGARLPAGSTVRLIVSKGKK